MSRFHDLLDVWYLQGGGKHAPIASGKSALHTLFLAEFPAGPSKHAHWYYNIIYKFSFLKSD